LEDEKPGEPQSSVTRSSLRDFILDLISVKNEGDSLAFSCTLLLSLLYNLSGTRSVNAHPVNQSGASSKEVSDIDILDSTTNRIISCFEVKDKNFTYTDVSHSVNKSLKSDIQNLTFIYSPDTFTGNHVEITNKLSSVFPTCELILVNVPHFIESIILLLPCVSLEEIKLSINKCLTEMRPKQDTTVRIKLLFKKHLDVSTPF
jgi:hypothetical protein